MEKTSLRSRIIALERGECITVPISEAAYTTVRTYASDLGFAFNRRYSVHRNRAERTYTITRIQ